MSKTTTRSAPSTKKNGQQRKGKKAQRKVWYQRVGTTTWIVAALVAAVVVSALLSRGNQVPEGPSAVPVVGADLHSLVIDPADPARLFIGSHDGVSVSTDGGETWTVRNEEVGRGFIG